MGSVYADIELINGYDLENARRHVIGKEEVKRMKVNMLVDSGAYSLAINETIQGQLDLPFIEKRKFVMPDGNVQEFELVGPVHIRYKNHNSVCMALLLKGDAEPILGSIIMQGLQTPLRLPSVKLL